MGYKDHKREVAGQDYNSLLLKPSVPHVVRFPSFEHGALCFRALPSRAPDGRVEPWRPSSERNDISDFAHGERIVNFFGCMEEGRMTCFARTSDQPAGRMSPVETWIAEFVTKIQQFPRSYPADWRAYLKDNKAQVSKEAKKRQFVPTKMRELNVMLIQAVVLKEKGEWLQQNGVFRPLCPAVIVLMRSALWAMEDLLNEEVEGTTEPWTSPKHWKIGDFLTPETGHVITVVGQRATHKTFAQYAVLVDRNRNFPLNPHWINSWKPWAEIKEYHTVESQIAAMVRATGPEMVDAFLGHTVYGPQLPEGVKGAFRRPGGVAAKPAAELVSAPLPEPSHATYDPGTEDAANDAPPFETLADAVPAGVPPGYIPAATPGPYLTPESPGVSGGSVEPAGLPPGFGGPIAGAVSPSLPNEHIPPAASLTPSAAPLGGAASPTQLMPQDDAMRRLQEAQRKRLGAAQ